MSIGRVTVDVADFVSFASPRAAPLADTRDSPRVRALMAAALEGDADAFGELVVLYERAVFRTALAALGDREDAEDVAQDAFILAWQKLGSFRGEASFKTWILTITWRRALDRRRTRRRWLGLGPPVTGGDFDVFDQVAATNPDPERIAEVAELTERVRRHISALSPKLRDTLLLAASGEHSYAQIARLLSIPLGTVKWRVAEARRLVNVQLDKQAGLRGSRS